MYEREKAAWARIRPHLAEDGQKFAVLKDDGLVGLYDTLDAAIADGLERFGPRGFYTTSLHPVFMRVPVEMVVAPGVPCPT